MNKKQAGERKRTVTLTLGPKTLAMLEAYRGVLGSGDPPMTWTLTDVVAALLRKGICGTPDLMEASDSMPWISEKL